MANETSSKPGIAEEIQYTKITKMQAISKIRDLQREIERITKRNAILVDAEFRQCKEIEQLREELEQVKKERDKALAYPTVDAYETACAALWKHRDEAESLRSGLTDKTNFLSWIRIQCQAEHLEPQEIIRRIAEQVEPMSLYATIEDKTGGQHVGIHNPPGS